MHILFHIDVKKSRYTHPIHEASQYIRKLTKNETPFMMLRQADIIVFEEIGLMSSALSSIPETAMKHITNNHLKMEGKMVKGNGDPFQLQAINGLNILPIAA